MMIPISFLLSLSALIGFVWSVEKSQLDDLETPAQRILLDHQIQQQEGEA